MMDEVVFPCPVDMYGLLAAIDLVESSKAVPVKSVKTKKSTSVVAHPTITVSPIHVDLPLAHRWSDLKKSCRAIKKFFFLVILKSLGAV